MSHEDDLSLTDDAGFARALPHEFWGRLRRDDPIHLTEGPTGPYWSVTRHADVKRVLSDAQLFSSNRNGVSLPTSPELADPTRSEHARLKRAGAMLPVLDPPRHAKARLPFIGRFSQSRVNALEDRVRDLVREILDEAPEGEGFDFVIQVAARLPSSMIFLLMDIPRSDWDLMFRYTNMHTAPDDPEFQVGSALETREQGVRGTVSYCAALARERRASPREDLISQIAAVEIDGQRLSEDELGFLGHMFIVAGQETTRNSLSAGLHQLLLNPAELQRLRADPTLLRTAADECVRWASPIAHLMRTAAADCDLHGKTIREGDRVVCWLASANRDERVFTLSNRFDVGRSPNPHLGFGFGPHFCLGALLARLQIRVMLQEIARRFRTIELLGAPEYVASIQFYGMKHLPVRFSR